MIRAVDSRIRPHLYSCLEDTVRAEINNYDPYDVAWKYRVYLMRMDPLYKDERFSIYQKTAAGADLLPLGVIHRCLGGDAWDFK